MRNPREMGAQPCACRVHGRAALEGCTRWLFRFARLTICMSGQASVRQAYIRLYWLFAGLHWHRGVFVPCEQADHRTNGLPRPVCEGRREPDGNDDD